MPGPKQIPVPPPPDPGSDGRPSNAAGGVARGATALRRPPSSGRGVRHFTVGTAAVGLAVALFVVAPADPPGAAVTPSEVAPGLGLIVGQSEAPSTVGSASTAPPLPPALPPPAGSVEDVNAGAAPPTTRATPRTASAARVGTLVIVVPSRTAVQVDGRVLRRRRTNLAPGPHVVLATLNGYRPVIDTVIIRAVTSIRWAPTLHRLPLTSAPPPPAPPPAAPAPTSRRRVSTPVGLDAVCRSAWAAEDWSRAPTECARAADRGSVFAMRTVAALYREGHGVRRSDDSATQWTGRAAARGDPVSMYLFAMAYEHGTGVKRDDATAFRWYVRAANTGFAAAQFTLGEAYEKGHLGLRKDRATALSWYRKAAGQGHRRAAAKVRDLGS